MSFYKGKKKFDREQLVFMVEAILIGALDRLGLPDDGIELEDRGGSSDFTEYEVGGFACAGMALGVLCHQLTDDGLGIDDALACAGDFWNKCENLVQYTWGDGLDSIREKAKELGNPESLYGNWYPDTRWHAEKFVDSVFKKYLGEDQK